MPLFTSTKSTATEQSYAPRSCDAMGCGCVATFEVDGKFLCRVHMGAEPDGWAMLTNCFKDRDVANFIKLLELAVTQPAVELCQESWVEMIKQLGTKLGVKQDILAVQVQRYRDKKDFDATEKNKKKKPEWHERDEPLQRYASRIMEWFIKNEQKKANQWSESRRAASPRHARIGSVKPEDLIRGIADSKLAA